MPRDLILTLAQTRTYTHRRRLMKRLSALGTPAVSVAEHLLGDADWRVREQAVIVLHHLRASACAHRLAQALLDDEAVNVRVRVAFALAHLGQKGDASLIDALTRALGDADGDVRYKACYALSRLAHAEDTSVFASLVCLLDDDVWYVRHSALKALYVLNPDGAQPHLRHAQQDAMRRVRHTAKALLSCYNQRVR